MILIVTPNLEAGARAEALRQATGEEIVLAESLRQAATLLRAESYLAVVLDQYLLETEPEETEMVMRHLGTAIPLQVKYGHQRSGTAGPGGAGGSAAPQA
jgi:hypothetical protein